MRETEDKSLPWGHTSRRERPRPASLEHGGRGLKGMGGNICWEPRLWGGSATAQRLWSGAGPLLGAAMDPIGKELINWVEFLMRHTHGGQVQGRAV